MKVTVKQTNLNNCIHNRGEKLVQWINNLHELESLSSTIRFVSVCVDNAKNHSRLIDKIWNDFITFDWNVCPIIQLNGVRVFCVCLFFRSILTNAMASFGFINRIIGFIHVSLDLLYQPHMDLRFLAALQDIPVHVESLLGLGVELADDRLVAGNRFRRRYMLPYTKHRLVQCSCMSLGQPEAENRKYRYREPIRNYFYPNLVFLCIKRVLLMPNFEACWQFEFQWLG